MSLTELPLHAAQLTEALEKKRRLGGGQTIEALKHDDALVTRDVVTAAAGISKSQLYRLIADGKFPKPIKQSARWARWRAGTVNAWLRAQAGIAA